MNGRTAAIGVLAGFLLATDCRAQVPVELEKLLDQSLRLEAKRARVVLQRALAMLDEESGNLAEAERDKLTAKVAEAVRKLARTPADVRLLFGDTAAWNIARQVTYRRYREQWLLESPLRLLATFDRPQAQELELVNVRVLPAR